MESDAGRLLCGHDELLARIAGIFAACGLPEAEARIAALNPVQAEIQGNTSHGVLRVPSLVKQLVAGKLNPRPAVRVTTDGCVVKVDGDGGLGQIAMSYALERAVCLAPQHPAVICLVERTATLGALGPYAARVADSGLLGLIMQRTRPLMSLGRNRAIGNNPLAFGAPLPGRAPLVFDMACSAVARGRLEEARRAGRPIPETWALDGDGHRTADPVAALDGALLPLADHKGLGLAMMVECFTRGLAGPDREVRLNGQLLVSATALVFNPDLANAGFAERMGAWADEFGAAAEGSSARLPGSGAPLRREGAGREGIMIPAATMAALDEAARLVGAG